MCYLPGCLTLRIDVCKGSEGVGRTVTNISFELVNIGKSTNQGVTGQGLSQQGMRKGELMDRRNNLCLNREKKKSKSYQS